MSISNNDLIAGALQEISVITEIATPSAEQGAHGLTKLNQMLAEWEGTSGIRLEYFAQTTLSDTCPIPDYAESAVICNLAIRLASTYGATVSAELAKTAQDGYDRILRDHTNRNLPEAELSNRPRGETFPIYNVFTDGF